MLRYSAGGIVRISLVAMAKNPVESAVNCPTHIHLSSIAFLPGSNEGDNVPSSHPHRFFHLTFPIHFANASTSSLAINFSTV